MQIFNHSETVLPALSTTNNNFRLSWVYADISSNNRSPSFQTRLHIDKDIQAGADDVFTFNLPEPSGSGKYVLYVSAVQEGVAWFHEKGMEVAQSSQIISVDKEDQCLSISD